MVCLIIYIVFMISIVAHASIFFYKINLFIAFLLLVLRVIIFNLLGHAVGKGVNFLNRLLARNGLL